MRIRQTLMHDMVHLLRLKSAYRSLALGPHGIVPGNTDDSHEAGAKRDEQEKGSELSDGNGSSCSALAIDLLAMGRMLEIRTRIAVINVNEWCFFGGKTVSVASHSCEYGKAGQGTMVLT